MPAKDPKRRQEIARLGALAQHKKHGCLIPIEARRKGGRNSGRLQRGGLHRNYGNAEKEFDEWAKSQNYKIYKHGFPDRAIEKDGNIIFVEVKSDKDKITKAQREMHKLFEKLGLNVIIWRPQ